MEESSPIEAVWMRLENEGIPIFKTAEDKVPESKFLYLEDHPI